MHDNSAYRTASPLIKLLAWLAVVAFGFVLFHLIMMELHFIPNIAMREIYFELQSGIPFFLFLTGTFIRNKPFRIPMILFFTVFFLCYLVYTLNFWDVIDFSVKTREGIKWTMGISLVGLLLTYLLYFIFFKAKHIFDFMKENPSLKPSSPYMSQLGKTFLDLLKLLWFLSIGYALLSIRFPIGFHGLFFFKLSIYLFPFLMALGLIRFFRKSSFL